MGETNYFIPGLLVGWITFGLVYVVYRQALKWWWQQRHGVPINHSLLLVEYGRKLTAAEEVETLIKILTQDLPSKLAIEHSELLLPKTHQLISSGSDEISLPVSNAAVRLVVSGGEAQRSDRGKLLELIYQGRTNLRWTRVWVPLMRGSVLRGMWLLGKRDGDVVFSPEDLQWLTSIAREAAAVLEALHFAEQERFAATEMRALYRQMVKTRELERGRISRELHDGVLQDLSAVTRDLKALGADRGLDENSFETLAEMSSRNVRTLRTICNDLRPPLLERDLAAALKGLVLEIDARSPAPVYINISAQVEDLTLPDETALAIFRIVQEAVNNAVQHADASEVAVHMTAYPDRLRLTVSDDGRGIAGNIESAHFVSEGHYGLAGMRERAAMIDGKLEVQTAVDYGTVVIFELPR
jgi:signal transduction histidine kinase